MTKPRCLRLSRSSSAPPARLTDKGMRRPTSSSNLAMEPFQGSHTEIRRIIKEVGVVENRPSSSSNVELNTNEGAPFEILQIIKDVDTREQRLSVPETRPRSRSDSKAGEGGHGEIQKIIKEIGVRENRLSHKEVERPKSSSHSSSTNFNGAHLGIHQIIKEVGMRERRRAHSNPGEQPPLSRRPSFSFLKRSKSTIVPRTVLSIPEVKIQDVSETKPETKPEKPKMTIETRHGRERSASAPLTPSSGTFDNVAYKATEELAMASVKPSRPAFVNATPRARSRSHGQYSLFPKTSPTPSPRTSPKVRPRAIIPPLPPLPPLEQPQAEKVEKPILPSIQINSQELPKPPMLKLQIPPKTECTTPELETKTEIKTLPAQPPPPPTSSSDQSPPKLTKRVTFSTSAEFIDPKTKSSAERRTSPSRHPSWSSVLSKSQRPSLTRHASLPAVRSPARTKSILRRTSSFHTEEEIDNKTAEQRIEENPMMVKNLKRLPRRSSRKNEPLPALPTTALESTTTTQPPVTKYTRHPIIIPTSAPSPPPSTTSSSWSSESAVSSSRSSRTSLYASSEEGNSLFKTVSEPIRFAKSPLSASVSAITRRETIPPPVKTSYWSSGNTAENHAAAQREGKWLRRGSYYDDATSAPPVPPVPARVRVLTA